MQTVALVLGGVMIPNVHAWWPRKKEATTEVSRNRIKSY